MTSPLLISSLLDSAEGPAVLAVEVEGADPRVTAPHAHARGQLFGAKRGLLTVGTEGGQWVVPAIHAVWVPPHHRHALRSHGAFIGWSVYLAESFCTDLPDMPCTMRTSGLLREAVHRAAGWDGGPLDAPKTRIAEVIRDELRELPHESFGLPLPVDARLLRIARAIGDDPADTRSLDDWAAWAGIAPRTLTRRFVAETGFHFSAWRQRARLMKALELLAAGTPVTNVALDLGYDNLSAFIAMFRRNVGVTPGRYFGA
ncbi:MULTISPECIES: helix-turn-helix domain-containing protein [unclassified Rhizobacter]|uniref:AraC family transcriptional regulator n=1 Tax=unclassified Rhizobacter TaxID=2640088 RepID=UPI0007010E9C|nr:MULTISPECIES: helix-turn-helix transcriptional regulator [unclassified Rhizobacter]KQU78354.1 AraC family transcriptional regulator [Rhizobacter sp. Root29]KQW10874.1 AraC family transcriptional regulator [Rhizobacter sp. Root1238]KRB25220.1 AraC family transcriptional regulator [Rhizobacter sp. Root16D2]